MTSTESRPGRVAQILYQQEAGWRDGMADAAAGVYSPRSQHPAYLAMYRKAQRRP